MAVAAGDPPGRMPPAERTARLMVLALLEDGVAVEDTLVVLIKGGTGASLGLRLSEGLEAGIRFKPDERGPSTLAGLRWSWWSAPRSRGPAGGGA